VDRQKTVAALLTAVLTLFGSFAGCGPGNTYAPPPPPEVTVSPPLQRSVTSYAEYTGTTKAFQSVDLRARVKGFLKQVDFQEGAGVKANQLLMVIDEEPFQVKVEMAKAKLEETAAALQKAEQSKAPDVAAAQLELDQAKLVLAKVEERRSRALLARNAASREDVDKAEATTKQNAAQVDADKASLEQARADYKTNILSARANVDAAKSDLRNAEIDLGYCRIYAPIDGQITRKLVDVNNLVGDGEATVLATIVKDDPIYAYMSASEADLLRFREMVSKGERVDYHKETIPLELGLANEQGFPHQGKLDYADPGVDPGTGTIQARGIFPNEKHVIVPGLFVRIRVAAEQHPNALLIPERALGADQGGRFLLVVNRDNVVEQRHVTVGAAEGTMRVIESGLKPDDLVVVNGVQRARPGLKVKTKRAETTPAKSAASSAPPSA
jgi:membrane fusion protein (multidrug efflux system)